MSMSKIKDVKLETTANYQPLSDLNVRFWNQDKNTAELRFIITRNQFPLSLSKENVKVIIALESESSFISSDDFIIDSEVEGVARYIIPTDFMRVASNVTGQVYVTTLDKEEIIVERQFKFTVSNDLLSDYPSEDKLRYIKTFDDLRNEIASRVSKLESDMETMEDYVTQVQDTTQEGITSLTNLIKQKQDAYNANHTAKMKELNDKGAKYSTKFDSDKSYMDEKFEAFKESVGGSGLVTDADAESWQKHKLTQDDGLRIRVSDVDPVELDTGYYQMWKVKNAPYGDDSNGQYWNVDVVTAYDNAKQIIATTSYEGRMFKKNIHKGEDRGWKEIAFNNSSNPFETVTDSQNKANVAENNAKVYADSKYNSRNTVIFEGSANGVGTVMDLSETLDNFIILYIYGSYPGGEFVATSAPTGPQRITVSNTNIIDADGNGGGIYELGIERTNKTTLTMSNDVYFDIATQEGSGANADKYTINKIVGVRK